MALTFRKQSIVAAPPSEVWRVVTSPAGINHELMPVVRMRFPPQLKGKAIDEMPLGQKLGRSWLFLFGFIPIDFDDMTIAERENGRRFLERSTMMSMSAWEHERTLVDRDGSSEVTDRITFQLRPPLGWLPGSHAVLGLLLRRLFGHRHRRLARRFRSANANRRVLAVRISSGAF